MAPISQPETAEIVDDARQLLAATGKVLPGGGALDEALPGEDLLADDEDQTEIDAPFAWFGIALPVPEAQPAIVATGAPTIAIELPDGHPAPVAAIALPEGLVPQQPEPVTQEIAKAIEAFDVAAAATPIDTAPEAPVRRLSGLDIARLSRIDGSAKIELPANSPMIQTLAALAPRTEGSPLAAMLAPATGFELPEQFRRPAPREPGVAQLTPLNGLEMQRAGIVQAVAEIQQAVTVDTRRDDWMTSTIERIEALRDSPNSRETSLRLSPDALGKVDVSIRQEGDRVHVRFSAETAAARTLLTEAQSRLNDIAEARGLKLGGTTVDAGTSSGQGQRHEAAPRTITASAPASALGSETVTTDANDARRVA